MNLLTICHGPSREHSAEFSVGVQSLPYLADHGLQGMVVLPGSFFIEMATILHRELFMQTATRIKDIKFITPVILLADDTVIRVDVTDRGTSVNYRFYEKSTNARTHALVPPKTLRLWKSQWLRQAAGKQTSKHPPPMRSSPGLRR